LSPKLSPRTQQLIERFFDSTQQAEVERLLIEECGNNLPFCDKSDEFKMERIRFAVLRMGIGDLAETQKAVDYAKNDWRDVLMWSGFGYDTSAHDKWAESALKEDQRAMIVIIMGVAGSGKTTIGTQLAITLNWMFYDADNFHSKENREKMRNGIPLTDEDRKEWLEKLRGLIGSYLEKKQNMILACSALKESYRQTLQINEAVRFVYLRGTYEQIEERMEKRKGHYMKPDMLKSQFEILQEPENALTVDIFMTPKEIVERIRKEWNL
jgi:gluconokinase